MKALNNQQTRELEQWAVDEGIPYITLMEHAGTAVAEYISSHYNIREKRTVILCRKHLTERFRFFDENVYC